MTKASSPQAFLSRDVEFTFQRIHTIRAKAGTPLQTVMTGTGPGYAISPGYVETDSPSGPGTLWAHDAKHYYIWAPSDAVTFDRPVDRASAQAEDPPEWQPSARP